MPSPTALSKRECERNGWTCEVVEHYNSYAKRRMDLFGFGDLLVLDGKPGSLIVQATTKPNISTRARKIEASSIAVRWLEASNRIEVWGWFKQPMSKGAKRMVWAVRIYRMKLEEPLIVTPSEPVITTIKNEAR